MLEDRSGPDHAERGGGQVRDGRERASGPFGLLAAVALLGLLTSPPSLNAQTVPPHLDYRTLGTAHFRVTFPAELEAVGRRAATSAERAYTALRDSFLPEPDGAIDLLLTDHSDSSNGFAEIFPSNRIVVWVQPPMDGLALSYFDEWLELVITHELVHIFHLAHAGTLGEGVRTVFGRVPWTWPAFPAYTTSPLSIEGVAVHRESLHTEAGRVRGSMHDAILRTQLLGGRAESVDQGLGQSPAWPGGDRPYVLGSLFFRHLADIYGEPAVVRFFEAMAGQWIPYRLNAAALDAFGVSFEALWAEWMTEVGSEAEALASRVAEGSMRWEPERITASARSAQHPAPAPSGNDVAYVRADGRSDSRLVLREGENERTLTRWNSLDRPAWLSGRELLVPQVEYVDTYRIYRDLFLVNLEGSVTRLTQGLRVVHSDPHPGRGEIVAVVAEGASNRLVVLSLDGDVIRVLRNVEPGVLWSYPAWSPDGERIAVARRRPGGRTAILLLNLRGGEIREVHEDESLNTAPAWSADGRAVLWSSDRSGVPNLYAARVTEGRTTEREGGGGFSQVTDLLTAGTFPSVSGSGDWIYFSLLGVDGWDVARIPYDPEAWFDPLPADPRYARGIVGPSEAPDSAALAGAAVRRYSALPTLLPRYWLPARSEAESVIGREILPASWGARTSGSDLVGRHEYDLRGTRSFGRGRSRGEWLASYAWAGLGNPTIVAETGQEWTSGGPASGAGGGLDAPPDTVVSLLKERWAGAALELRRRRMRSSSSLALGARVISQTRDIAKLDGEESERFEPLRPSSNLAELRLSMGLSTARAYPLSVSLESGARLSVGLRARWDRSVPDSLVGRTGADGGFREAVATIDGFHGIRGPGYANHVLALRVAFGAADGPASGLGHFGVGGGAGDGRGVLGFTLGSAFRRFPVRGVPAGAERGNTALSMSGEWRFPVAMVNAGAGAWPLHMDRVAGSLFFDLAGAGRNVEGFGTRWHAVSSLGVELMVFGSLFFEQVDRVRAGLAIPLETPAGSPRGASVYVQTGWAF